MAGARALALLLLLPALAGAAQAQGNATEPEPPPEAPPEPPAPEPPRAPGAPARLPFEAQPAELQALAAGWLAQANATIQGFRAETGKNTTIMDIFRDGAWDFLNESRLSLATTQLYQIELQAKLERWLPAVNESERRAAALAFVGDEGNKSRAVLDSFWARLRAFDARVATTHGLEYALFATASAVVADGLLRAAPNMSQQLAQAPAAEERIIRLALLFHAAPGSYARWAGDLLGLAEGVEGEPGRPRLPPGALDKLAAGIVQRLALDAESSSITGPGSSEAGALLAEANASGPRILHVARFLAFEQARTGDALDFRLRRGTLAVPVLADNLRLVVENASFEPVYDGRIARAEPPSLLQDARAAGFQGVLQADALNHALYRLNLDFENPQGLTGAWAQMVGARYATEVQREAPAQAPGGEAPWLLYGGIAVAAALAVVAVVVLRRPGT